MDDLHHPSRWRRNFTALAMRRVLSADGIVAGTTTGFASFQLAKWIAADKVKIAKPENYGLTDLLETRESDPVACVAGWDHAGVRARPEPDETEGGMMPTVAEAIARRRSRATIASREWSNPTKYRRFYSSRAFRFTARYAYLKKLPRPLRCMCCGATAKDARLCVDHRIPLKPRLDSPA